MSLGLGLGLDKNSFISVGGFTGLLDTYSGAAAAYSIRLLSSTYSGALIEIRRSSDNSTKSFLPDSNNELSLSSEAVVGSQTLGNFIGSNDGFVVTWYDQSGNSNDATQSTASAQPQIISSGSLITENGKAAISTDGNKSLKTSFLSINQPITSSQVGTIDNRGFLSDGENSTNVNSLFSISSSELRLFNSSSGIINSNHIRGNQELYTYLSNGANSFLAVNNSETSGTVGTGNMGGFTFFKAATLGTVNMIGKGQEFVFWDDAATYNNISDIKSNVNDFFSIY